MSAPYEELIDGERVLRLPPGPRHEEICNRLRRKVAEVVNDLPSTLLLDLRARVEVVPRSAIRPDLALVTSASNKLWLAAEVISSEDHHADTVAKKALYQDLKLPRLWIVDPRYDNVEVYHGTPFGITLKHILGGRELLTDSLLPGFQLAMRELFAGNLGEISGPFHF